MNALEFGGFLDSSNNIAGSDSLFFLVRKLQEENYRINYRTPIVCFQVPLSFFMCFFSNPPKPQKNTRGGRLAPAPRFFLSPGGGGGVSLHQPLCAACVPLRLG